MYEKKYDEIIMKLLYSKLGFKYCGQEYAKQRVFVKNLLKKFNGEDLIDVINYCAVFRQKGFKNTYFLYANAETLIPMAKSWKQSLNEIKDEEQKIEQKIDNTKKTTKIELDLW